MLSVDTPSNYHGKDSQKQKHPSSANVAKQDYEILCLMLMLYALNKWVWISRKNLKHFLENPAAVGQMNLSKCPISLSDAVSWTKQNFNCLFLKGFFTADPTMPNET